jgi:Ca2+-binding RTX toxin-like protein
MRFVLALLMLAATPGTAHAATLVNAGGRLTYTAGPNESNRLSISGFSLGSVRLTSANGVPVTVRGCAPEAGGYRCEAVTAVVLDLGDGDDRVEVSSRIPVTTLGGAGRDSVVSHVESGDDVLAGGAGIDTLVGSEGDDRFDARDGFPDRVDCGPGRDTVLADPMDQLGDGCEVVHVRDAGNRLEDRPPRLQRLRLDRRRLTVEATDDFGVAHVRFFVDGRRVCTDRGAPFTCRHRVRGGATVVAIATDGAGQTSSLVRARTP